MKRFRLVAGAFVLAAGAVAGVALVGSDRTDGPKPAAGSPAATVSPSPSVAPPSPRPAPSPPHPVSLQALMQQPLDGSDFKVGRVLARNTAYTRYFISFESSGLTIAGVMNVPRAAGKHPVVIMNHGYRDPETYRNGEGLEREHDYLARRGYVIVHPDYRNHGLSDDDPDYEMNLRLGYTLDALNAIVALQNAALPYADAEKVGMLGRSMGGGVTMNAAVVRPDLIDAVVLYAPVSSLTIDNFNKWTRPNASLARAILAAYGSPETNAPFWRGVSPRYFFSRLDMPVVIHHGTRDLSTPYSWTQATLAAMQGQDADVTLYTYPGEPHVFQSGWALSARRTVSFFDAHLK